MRPRDRYSNTCLGSVRKSGTDSALGRRRPLRSSAFLRFGRRNQRSAKQKNQRTGKARPKTDNCTDTATDFADLFLGTWRSARNEPELFLMERPLGMLRKASRAAVVQIIPDRCGTILEPLEERSVAVRRSVRAVVRGRPLFRSESSARCWSATDWTARIQSGADGDTFLQKRGENRAGIPRRILLIRGAMKR